MYDPEVNSSNHLYWSNNILSHNTITVAAYLLWCIIFNKNYTIAILANKAAKAQEILSRIKLMYEELPFWLKPGVKKWNEQSVHFSNGSLLFSSATSESSIRGFSVNLVYIDEMAFIPRDVQFYTSTYPVIASGKTSKIILTSTPNGLNLFYKIYTDAVHKRNDYAYYDCLWYKHPHRDEAWKKETIRNTSEHQFKIEHECVRGDHIVTVRDKITGEIKNIKIEDLYNEINDCQLPRS